MILYLNGLITAIYLLRDIKNIIRSEYRVEVLSKISQNTGRALITNLSGPSPLRKAYTAKGAEANIKPYKPSPIKPAIISKSEGLNFRFNEKIRATKKLNKHVNKPTMNIASNTTQQVTTIAHINKVC